jgi:hypothetical protein
VWKLAFVAACVSVCAAKTKDVVTDPAPAYQPLGQAVKAYLDLRKHLTKELPKLPDRATPEQIAAHKLRLREAIQRARADAKPGDILVASARPHLLKAVRAETRGAPGKTAKNTIMKDNPKAPGVPGDVKLRVNAPYPADAPVTTVPPDLLLRLPTLPQPLEFRFVGRALILRDAEAAIVLDYLPDALPPGGSQ